MEMEKQYKHIDSFYQKIISEEIFKKTAFVGCSIEDISKVELLIKSKLPASVKEFLKFCGRKWRGTYVLKSLFNNLVDTQPYKILEDTILESDDLSMISINPNEIIIIDFEEHLGDYHWNFYYRNDNKENPDIYSISYEEVKNHTLTFTQFIERKLQTANEFALKLFVSELRFFESSLTFINSNAIKSLVISSHELSLESSYLLSMLPNIEELTLGTMNSYPDREEKWNFTVPFSETLSKIRIGRHELINITLPEEGLPKLDLLSISSKNLISPPKNLSKCKNLTQLHINNTKIDLPPSNLEYLEKLKTVKLAGNLREFPEGLYSLTQVEEIILSGNIISKIDGRIKNLKTLKKLNIDQNCFSDDELKFLINMIPSVNISSYNQKPYIKANANPNRELQINLEENIFENYIAILEKNNICYIKGSTNGSKKFIYTNTFDYPKCIELLDKFKES
ncbi:MAG: Leucine-rich repeat (LRR) protein [Urechidicola sp.]|jgi:Leucine-rich repeat (LRR) protein